MITIAHLLYIPLTLAIGIYIGHRLGREAERKDRQKQKELREIRNKRTQSTKRPAAESD